MEKESVYILTLKLIGLLPKELFTLIVSANNIYYQLSTEPDLKLFDTTIKSKWKTWDTNYGSYYDDRKDYQPWAYNSLRSLAFEFKLVDTCETRFHK